MISVRQPSPQRLYTYICVLTGFIVAAPALMIAGYSGADELVTPYEHYQHAFLNIGSLFYRPIMYLLWIPVARALVDYPTVFHAAFVLCHLLNAGLLLLTVRLL